jgi:hypothetical protein
MVVPVGQVVAADDERDEEQGVDERAGAVAGRAASDQGAEVLEAEGDVREEEACAGDEVQDDVPVAQRLLDEDRAGEPDAEDDPRRPKSDAERPTFTSSEPTRPSVA